MRDYGKVFSSFWTSESTRILSSDGRLLALYLLTSPHTTMIGAFRLPDGYVADDMGWGFERVAEGFQNLVDNGFATRCAITKWVVVTHFMEWNEIENPNQAKAAIKLVEQVPAKHPLKPVLVRGLLESIGRFKDKIQAELWNRLETLSKGLPNQEQEQEQEQEPLPSVGGGDKPAEPPSQSMPAATPPAAPEKSPRGSRLSQDWTLPKPWGEWALAEQPTWNADKVRKVADQFRDHWVANANQANAKKSDWEATWRNWVRKEGPVRMNGHAPPGRSNPHILPPPGSYGASSKPANWNPPPEDPNDPVF